MASANRPASPIDPAINGVKTNTKNPLRVRERRDALVNAAIEVFSKKGFHGATVRDIGRAAGLTQGTIYNYVGSKEDILYMTCDRVVAEYTEETRRALALAREPAERVRSAVSALTEVMYRHRRAIRMIYQNVHALDVRSRAVVFARVQEFIGLFETILKEAAAEMKVPLADPHLAANLLTYVPSFIALRNWALQEHQDAALVQREITDFIVRGLGMDVRSAAAAPGPSAAPVYPTRPT